MQFHQQLKGSAVRYQDPVDSMLSDLNNMMVQGSALYTQAMHAGESIADLLDDGVSADQSIEGTSKTTLNVFKTDYAWFIGAAVLDVVVIISLLPLFRGFWLFPRYIKLSPLELALAFRSPLVEEIHSMAGADGAVERLGDTRVRYGVFDERTPGGERILSSAVGSTAIMKEEDVQQPDSRAVISR